MWTFQLLEHFRTKWKAYKPTWEDENKGLLVGVEREKCEVKSLWWNYKDKGKEVEEEGRWKVGINTGIGENENSDVYKEERK